jgi:uncharacterized protein
MVDIKQLQDSLQSSKRPPLEQWNPPFCGDIDIQILQDGRWLYRGSEINRPALVRLFASVLWREKDEYFLLTPAEKVRIQVEDLPFCILRWQYHETHTDVIQVDTNTAETYLLSEDNPLIIDKKLPAVKIRDGFLARVHRNVYYQWSEIVTPAKHGESAGFYLQSGSARFLLGS